MVQPPRVTVRPNNVVTSRTDQTVRNKEGKCHEGVGWEDPGGGQREVYSRKGHLKAEQRSIRASVHCRTEVNGKVVQEARSGAAMAPATTTTRIVKTGQQDHKVKNSTKCKKKIAIESGAENKSKALDTSSSGISPVQQSITPLSLRKEPDQHQQQVQVAPPAHSASNLLSPTASVASSQDSGFASLSGMQQSSIQQTASNKPTQKQESTTAVHPPTLPLKEPPHVQQQLVMAPPAGVTLDLLSPNGSDDSGFSEGQANSHPQAAERPSRLPYLQEQQQVAQPALATIFSPASSVASKDSRFASVTDDNGGQQNGLAEGESSEPAKDKDDNDGASSDSGNGSPDEFSDDKMDTD